MSTTIRALAAAGAILFAVTGLAYADTAMVAKVDGKSILVDRQGMTLYQFKKDPKGKSVCSGACAALWPPLKAGPGAVAKGDYSIITRKDGAKQWAYNGKPLYLYSLDTKKGQMKGNGFKGLWSIVPPQSPKGHW